MTLLDLTIRCNKRQFTRLDTLCVFEGLILPNFEANARISQIIHVYLKHTEGRLLIIEVFLGGLCSRHDIILRLFTILVKRVLVNIFAVVEMVNDFWFISIFCRITLTV